ncbi:hypothetical protein [Companilactobacillus zhongbaensis]|uniref:hypothetical protein n=1 Tax=Companilactobacillus zhongbaensis TaxID=2486009 RepID=UPI0013DE495A|nr:hypothetical protein [Companilactobacillus zhongbaensis]
MHYLDGGARDTHLSRQIVVGDLSLTTRLVLEMSGRTSRIASIDVGSVPVCVSRAPESEVNLQPNYYLNPITKHPPPKITNDIPSKTLLSALLSHIKAGRFQRNKKTAPQGAVLDKIILKFHCDESELTSPAHQDQ